MAAPEHPRTAVLLGASGATGQRLLPRLLDNPLYGKVVTVSRRETGITHAKLENRIVDFDNLAKGFEGPTIDDAYCTFGTTLKIAGSKEAMTRIDHDYVLDFAKAAQTYGAKRFAYLSAANADATSSVYYARLKGQTEEALKALGFPSLAIFRPSMIIAQRSNRRWAEEMLFPLLPLLDKVLLGGLDKYRSIPVETLARAIGELGGGAGEGVRTFYWRDMVWGENLTEF